MPKERNIVSDTDFTHVVQPGERFYLTGIAVKSDRITFTLLSVELQSLEGPAAKQRLGTSPRRDALRLEIPLKKHEVDSLTVSQVHQRLDPIFSPAKGQHGEVVVQVGQKRADVEQALGPPQQAIDEGNEMLLIYPHVKVTLRDGRVVRVE